MADRRPDFSSVALGYARSRPTYPKELFEWLAALVPGHEAAWDVATGNGQAVHGLHPFFRRVLASDISARQLSLAAPFANALYFRCSAESPAIQSGSLNLIVAAAAVHWFDRPVFYNEVRRLLTPGGVLACWSYHAADLEPPFDSLFHWFYYDVMQPYFPHGRELVDDRYRGLDLPGDPVEPPRFEMTARWTRDQIVDYVRTWSGLKPYVEAHGTDPVLQFEAELDRLIDRDERPVYELRWPMHIRVSRPV